MRRSTHHAGGCILRLVAVLTVMMAGPQPSLAQVQKWFLPAGHPYPSVSSIIEAGDVNQDGYPELFMAGQGNFPLEYNNPVTRTFLASLRPDGNHGHLAAPLPTMPGGALAWGDVNNDNRLDLGVIGQVRVLGQDTPIAMVMHYSGFPLFTTVPQPMWPMAWGDIDWVDFDNDGDLDLSMGGYVGSVYEPDGYKPQWTPFFVYENRGPDEPFVRHRLPLAVSEKQSIEWGDYDNDGDMDVVSFYANFGVFYPTLLRNDGEGRFTQVSNAFDLIGTELAAIRWFDLDNDGDLDIAFLGKTLRVYRNQGNGAFGKLGGDLPGAKTGDLLIGDFNSDGFTDLLLFGEEDFKRPNGDVVDDYPVSTTRLYSNQQGLWLRDVTYAGLSPTDNWRLGEITDINRDGRLDLILSGRNPNGGLNLAFLANNLPEFNHKPGPPAGLKAEVTGQSVLLSWEPAADLETASPGLTYNIRIGTTPGGSELMSAMALADGTRLVARRGNADHNLKWPIHRLPRETTFYWSVQAIDNGFLGGPFAPEATFVTPNFPAVTTGNTTDRTVNSAVIHATVNPRGYDSTFFFEWGTGTNLDQVTPPVPVGNGTNVLARSHGLSGLSLGTRYSYRAVATNEAGRVEGETRMFATRGPVTITMAATGISPNGATVNGLVIPADFAFADTQFEWGTTTNLGQLTPRIRLTSSTNEIPRSHVLTNLAENTRYYYRLFSTNLLGRVNGAVLHFDTVRPMPVANASFPALGDGEMRWGDFDNDGDLDVVYCGNGQSGLLRNDGSAGFVPWNIDGPQLRLASVAPMDFDGDGWLDVAMMGALSLTNPSPSGILSELNFLRNNRDGTFSRQIITGRGHYNGSMVWGDVDNNGTEELIVAGQSANFIYHRRGNLFEETVMPLSAVPQNAMDLDDVDGDGDLDLLLTGDDFINYGQRQQCRIHLNDGFGGFTLFTNLNHGHSAGTARFVDYDLNGMTDVFTSGFADAGAGSLVFLNTGQGGFLKLNAALPGLYFGDADWTDYNFDGFPDVLMTGTDGMAPQTKLLLNRQGFQFNELDVPLPQLQSGSLQFGDYDADGDPDLLLNGLDAGGNAVAQVRRNDSERKNTPPSRPVNLNVAINGADVLLTWDNSSDDTTHPLNLRYRVRVGTRPGGSDIVSGLALADGTRTIPGRTSTRPGARRQLRQLRGHTYHWAVQAIDVSGAGSEFSDEQSFVTTADLPQVELASPTNILLQSALLTGRIHPGELETRAWFELADSAGFTNIDLPIIPALGSFATVQHQVTNLRPGTDYTVQLHASNQLGTVHSPVLSLLTLGPKAESLYSTNVGATAVTLVGRANSRGSEARCWFEWGDSETNLVNRTPMLSVPIDQTDFLFTERLINLTPNQPYLWRFICSNQVAVTHGELSSWTNTPYFLKQASDLFVAASPYSTGVAPALWDGDHWMDLILGTWLYQNRDAGALFTPRIEVAQDKAVRFAWGDANGDGAPDLAVAPSNLAGARARILFNVGGAFVERAQLPVVNHAALAWVDYDNDGDLDLALAGMMEDGPKTLLFRNDGDGKFAPVDAGFVGVDWAGMGWCDHDVDGDMDLMLTGRAAGGFVSRLYLNTAGTFAPLPAAFHAASEVNPAWGDINADGLPDVIVAGANENGATAGVYLNQNGLQFTEILIGLPYILSGDAFITDFNNDGRTDLWTIGPAFFRQSVRAVQYNGPGRVELIDSGLPANGNGASAMADFTGDGKLDFLLTGIGFEANPFRLYGLTNLFVNRSERTNTRPQAPISLTSLRQGNTIEFNWSPGSDAETPTNALAYNLRVGLTPGGNELMSSHSMADGRRQLPAPGNTGASRRWTLRNMPTNQNIYWSVQTVDMGWSGSSFAAERAIELNGKPPLATVLPPTAVTTNSAIFRGEVSPGGASTIAWFEWWADGQATNRTPLVSVGNGTNWLTTTRAINDLPPEQTLNYRVWVQNSFGTNVSQSISLETRPHPPSIAGWTALGNDTYRLSFDSSASGDGLWYQSSTNLSTWWNPQPLSAITRTDGFYEVLLIRPPVLPMEFFRIVETP